jgi:hypothetical protein
MTSREHARRLMLILLSSEARPGAEAPEPADADGDRDEDEGTHEDERAESDRRFKRAEALIWR